MELQTGLWLLVLGIPLSFIVIAFLIWCEERNSSEE